jgi:hypothetical protein
MTNYSYWLNEGKVSNHIQEKKGLMKVEKNDDLNKTVDGECMGIYFYKLIRDGWKKIDETSKYKSTYKVYFHKNINNSLVLCKIFTATSEERPVGKGCYYETHEIINTKNKIIWEYPDWEWADLDFDKNYIIWAEYGKINRGCIDQNGIKLVKELFDTNSLTFEELKAPY